MIWRARQKEWRCPRATLVMGILNVTPDSFSDGGRFFALDKAIEHALAMVADGADIIDIGGESTRPNAAVIGEAEELGRVVPVINALRQTSPVAISIDTMKPAVARAALEAGADIVNDVAAAAADPAMAALVAETGAGYVAMHMRGTPQTMQVDPNYKDVVAEVGEFFTACLDWLRRAGVSEEQVVLDPGIGFGKRLEHNLALLSGMEKLRNWQRPLLVGVSRKSFLGQITGAEAADRLAAGLAATCMAVERGAVIVRTHDVAATRHALQVTEAILRAQQS